MKKIYYWIGFLILAGCGYVFWPQNRLNEQIFVEVLVDLELAKALYTHKHTHVKEDQEKSQEHMSRQLQLVCKIHHTDVSTFVQSYQYYLQQEARFVRIYKRVIDRVKEQLKTVQTEHD